MARKRASLTLDDVISIRVLIGVGVSIKQIAKSFATSKQNIQSIKSGRSWCRVNTDEVRV